MYCKRCGSVVDVEQAFCDACGAQLKIDGVQQQNAISDTAVVNPEGVQGQPAQKKYIILGWVVTAAVFVRIILKLLGIW